MDPKEAAAQFVKMWDARPWEAKPEMASFIITKVEGEVVGKHRDSPNSNSFAELCQVSTKEGTAPGPIAARRVVPNKSGANKNG